MEIKFIQALLGNVEVSLTKLGIRTKFKITSNIGDTVNAVSEDIPMVPQLFENLTIEAKITAKRADEKSKYKDVTMFYISLDYIWYGFNGGENGMRLGNAEYFISNKYYDKIVKNELEVGDEEIYLFIHRAKGIEI
jgi:hypothetical protein